jgi:aspartate aminotransferase
MSLLNPGDEVIIPAPYWVSYPDMVKLADAVPVIIKADIDQKFKITPAQLESAITPKTRLVILNSPSNPTGVAYTRAELKALSAVLLKYPNIAIASDDIYEHTLWSKEPFANILMVCPELNNQTIVINGASKAYAMTGWRIGYAAGPTKLIAAMKKIQSQSTSNPTSISQAAVEAALKGDQSFITVMVNAYKERHDFILGELQKMSGVKVMPCDGTFYIFPNFDALIKKSSQLNNDIDLADYLLTVGGIAVVPGSAFGAPGYLRISYAASMAEIKEAMKRMSDVIAKLA